ncbi:MAG: polyribonucleotide nucleotidyltransferase, partial [Turicibacter sp.]
EIGKEKMELKLYEVEQTINDRVRDMAEADMLAAIQVVEKHARQEAIDAVNKRVLAIFTEEEATDKELKQVKEVLNKIVKEEVRRLITDEKVRPDGRGIAEIRPLSSRLDLLPRTHGSALFTRGQTQALSVCTLGALNEHQMLDGLEVEETKRFMHHYNFPPFSVGETGRYGAPGRREVGHGALGERALKQVMPSEKEFPYTIRLVSEVLESNGSTSQASICASTMALMAAGVPIVAPVAGIAMGLVKKGENYSVLSDIQGMEDHLGDMDFKVAGTAKGVTALQMDIKIEGLSRQILEEALQQAKIGRMHILNHMLETIGETRDDLSTYAPKIRTMNIKVEKIRDVIGPGGKQINEIIDKTGVKIDIEQDGTVYILHDSTEAIKKAVAMIEDIVREVEIGKIYLGKVVRIEKFGAFVELYPGQDGLVHISQLAEERVAKTEDVVALGDEILVKVTEVDDRGRVNLSRKEAMKQETQPQA